VSKPTSPRRGRLGTRATKLPSERDWERAATLDPRPGPRDPELLSDGAGLPFAPAALLLRPPGALDPTDPAASALLAYLTTRATPRSNSRVPWKRSAKPPPGAPPTLEHWRLLARTDGEVLFGRGRPPELLTVTLRRTGLRRAWTYVASDLGRPLRAMRDGIRASSWRLDPTQAPESEETVLRVLVTEQSFATGQRADGRVLAPDLYVDEDELVLTMFVTPRPGYQSGAPNPETPVRIALPHPVGARRLIDGALTPSSPSR
jgi:hypothetical protein